MALQEQLRTVLGSRQPTPEEAVPLALHVLMCAAGFVARDGHGNALPGCEPPADWTENSKQTAWTFKYSHPAACNTFTLHAAITSGTRMLVEATEDDNSILNNALLGLQLDNYVSDGQDGSLLCNEERLISLFLPNVVEPLLQRMLHPDGSSWTPRAWRAQALLRAQSPATLALAALGAGVAAVLVARALARLRSSS